MSSGAHIRQLLFLDPYHSMCINTQKLLIHTPPPASPSRLMNVSSGAQIRQLLFPDHIGHTTKAAAEAAVKAARAAKAEGRPAAAGPVSRIVKVGLHLHYCPYANVCDALGVCSVDVACSRKTIFVITALK